MPKMTVTQELRAAQEEHRRLSEEHQRLIGRTASAIVLKDEDGRPMTVVEELCATLEAIAQLKETNAFIIAASKPKPKPVAPSIPAPKPAPATTPPADAGETDTVLVVDGTGKKPARRVKRDEIKPWWSK